MTRRQFMGIAAVAMGATMLAGCSSSEASQPSASESAPSAPASSSSPAVSASTSSAASATPIVMFFSQTGNTAAIASHIKEHLNCDSFELKAAEPYTSEDLDYNDPSTRATVEQNAPETRPAIAGLPSDLAAHDVVFLGYPIWWGKVPRIMCTLAETCDLSGKTIVPFCTSGSSDIGSTADELAALASPSAAWVPGKRFAAGTDSQVVGEWVDSLSLQ